MPKFVLPKSLNTGKDVVISGRYAFVNGEMPCSKGDAEKLEKILCRFHGCTLVYEEPAEKADDKGAGANANPSLKVDATKEAAKK